MDVGGESEVKARIKSRASMQMAQRRSVAGVGVLSMVLMAMSGFYPAMAVLDLVEGELSSILDPLPILPSHHSNFNS